MKVPATRKGSTLVELMVVLAIIALATSVTALAIRTTGRASADPIRARIAGARRAAIDGGAPVTIEILVNGRRQAVTARPDGVVLGASAFGAELGSGDAAP